MPIARKTTPPTSQIKEHLSVLSSLSAWTDTGEDEEEERKHGQAGYKQSKQNAKVPADAGEQAAEADAADGNTGNESACEAARCLCDVESDNFNMFIGLVIVANAVVIGLETDFGREEFVVFEHFFNAVFFLEMVIRLQQLRNAYFGDTWNIFDFSLVMIGSLDLWILPLAVGSAGGTASGPIGYHLSCMRLLRFLRLLRVLRVIRLFRMFTQLNLIMQAFGKAFQIVMLISLLVVILDYVLAIVLTQSVGHNAETWGEHADQINDMFGTISSSMNTLFLIMTLANWEKIAFLLTKVIPAPVVLFGFVAYIMVTSYTMVSLITAIITESLSTSQQEYKWQKLQSMDKKRKVLAGELVDFISEMNEDNCDEEGSIPAEDVKTSVRGDTELLRKLAEIDISISENGILSLVDKISRDGQERVPIQYFVDKLVNLTGIASASYVADLNYEIAKTEKQLVNLDEKLNRILKYAFPDENKDREEKPQVDVGNGPDARQEYTPEQAVPRGKRSSLRKPKGHDDGPVRIKEMRFSTQTVEDD